MKLTIIGLVLCLGLGCEKNDNSEATNPEQAKSKTTAGVKFWEFETGGSLNSSLPLDLMVRFTLGQMTRSMQLMARLGSSYEFRTAEVYSSPPSDLMARSTSVRGPSFMPSMARLGSSYGNLERLEGWLLPRHRL